jgi:hypothetical protein
MVEWVFELTWKKFRIGFKDWQIAARMSDARRELRLADESGYGEQHGLGRGESAGISSIAGR